MKKFIVLILITIGTSATLMAQDKADFKLSVGPELQFATGVFHQTQSIGIGATIQAEKSLQENLYGTATTGIIFFNGRSVDGAVKQKGQTIIPIKVGVKYFFMGGVYGAAQIGVGIFGNNILNNGTAFAYTPALGYEFRTSSGKAVDATFKYDGYSKSGGTLGAIGFRVAYIF